MEVPVKPRRPPSLPLICEVIADYPSFSVFKKTPMAFTRYHLTSRKRYEISWPLPLFLELVVLLPTFLEMREKRCEQKKEGKTQRNR